MTIDQLMVVIWIFEAEKNGGQGTVRANHWSITIWYLWITKL